MLPPRGLAKLCGRSPDAYEMACDSMEVSKGCCGPLVARGGNHRKVEAGVVAWTGGVRFTTQPEGYVRRMNL